ncbi:ShlB/FhaC/HecB family hemolysin secretion/activation protein, partial [Formosimonas limnophila]|uniref:ShlB/FhaC/HecB family hemolysin secretion/activation protein n=1 Tax=Formosimonas limnophila TaxID=1384487 RepID=UPI00167438C1
HITSKVDFPEQNIASGTLMIEWYPGTVGKVSYETAGGKPIGSVAMLFPNREGQLYNQRQADQALENLKRLSSQGNASIDLRPGEVAGTSDIVYKIETIPFIKRINGSIGIDNAGSESTGEYQLNGSISIDSPLHLNDQLTLNYNRNADADNNQHNTKTTGAYWDIATGYATFGLGYNKSSYLQTVPGYISNLSYEGKSQDWYASAGAMLHRNSNSKTQATFKIGRKISHNYIDDTEIPVQMRDYVYT